MEGLNIQVLGFQTEIDFKDGSTTYFLVLEMQGRTFKALITEETAEAITRGSWNAPEKKPQTAGVPLPSYDNEYLRTTDTRATDGAVVFGGQDPSEQPVPGPVRKVPRIARVDKDEYGYPIVRRPGSVDPSTLIGAGTGAPDEDGVGQG